MVCLLNIMFKNFHGNFIKNIGIAVTGTSLSQIISLMFYPIFTRLYSSEDFGLMALFMSVTTSVVVISSGAYEQAILICKDKVELDNLMKLILIRSLIMLAVISLTLLILLNTAPLFLNYKVYQNWIFIVSLTAFFTIIYGSYNEYCVKQKKFKNLGVSKVYNSLFVSLQKSINKFLSFISNGLIFGELIGKGILSLICLRSMKSMGANIFKDYNIKVLNKTRQKFKVYPRFMMFDILINTLGGSVHVYIILLFFNASELGYISLSLSLLTLPVTVISGGIKDVFREKANQLFVSSGSCRKLYVDLLKPLAVLGFIGFGILYFIVPYAIPLALGNDWG